MQELEIVVAAETWDEAIELLAEVGIDEKSKISHRPINGLFMVSASKDQPLTEVEYEKFKNSPNIAILSDSISRNRISEVLDKVYDVETQLRKLLLHAYDLIDTFFEVFAESKYTKEFRNNKSIARVGSLNPITSHLTLGEMQNILGVDLSWAGRKSITPQELNSLLQESADISEVKQSFAKKVEVNTVWDVIAANVLKTSTSWNDVHNDLKVLKDFRDQSAHYQVITEKQKDKLIEKADSLLEKITPKRRTTKQDYQNLFLFSKDLSKSLTSQLEVYKSIQKQLLPDIKDFIYMNSQISKDLKELGKIDLGWIKDYQKNLNEVTAQFNTFNNLSNTFRLDGVNDRNDDSEDDETSDEDSSDSSKS